MLNSWRLVDCMELLCISLAFTLKARLSAMRIAFQCELAAIYGISMFPQNVLANRSVCPEWSRVQAKLVIDHLKSFRIKFLGNFIFFSLESIISLFFQLKCFFVFSLYQFVPISTSLKADRIYETLGGVSLRVWQDGMSQSIPISIALRFITYDQLPIFYPHLVMNLQSQSRPLIRPRSLIIFNSS